MLLIKNEAISLEFAGLKIPRDYLSRMEEFQKAQAEVEKKNGIKPVSQKMFKAI